LFGQFDGEELSFITNKAAFWDLVFKDLEGRLGLFHCVQRMTKTLKKRHIDDYLAISRLTNCIYNYHVADYDNLPKALKEGTLSGSKHSDSEINDMKNTRMFKQRCDKCLRKETRPAHIICNMLDDWFDSFKCSTSNQEPHPASGGKDPITGETLFSSETKEAVQECKRRLLTCRIH